MGHKFAWVRRRVGRIDFLGVSLAGLLAVLVLGSGCASGSTCGTIEREYEQALAAESRLEERTADEENREERAAQIGLTVRADLLNELSNRALGAALKSGLNQLAKLDVGQGQTVAIETAGELVNVKISPDKACTHCFRVEGTLDGEARLNIPLVEKQRTSLDGTLSLVAPIVLGENPDGGGALKLDLAQAAKLGRPALVANLGSLPGSWNRVLRSELSAQLLEALLQKLKPVTLLSFKGPDFGIPGMEIVPTSLKGDAESGSIFLGFRSNIAGLSGEQPVADVASLKKDENLAISFNPNLVVHAAALMMQKKMLPRRYSSDGRPLKNGSAHAHLERIEFSKGRYGEVPMALDFNIFNFGEEASMCYRFKGQAAGRIALRGEKIEVSLSNVEIVDASVPGLANAVNWTQAEFLRGSKTILRQTLDDQNIEVPGTTLAFKGLTIGLEKGTVVLRGISQPVLDDAD